jgi:hypothetical protein
MTISFIQFVSPQRESRKRDNQAVFSPADELRPTDKTSVGLNSSVGGLF